MKRNTSQASPIALVIQLGILLLLWGCDPSPAAQSPEPPDDTTFAYEEIPASYSPTRSPEVAAFATMPTDTLDCRAEAFWRIVKRGKDAIPELLESLSDTTPTPIRSQCKAGKLNVAEVADIALKEIGEFPEFVVTHIQFDVIDLDGCWNFYDYFYNNSNKAEYQVRMKEFYAAHGAEMQRWNIDEKHPCRRKFGIKGYYRWEEP